MTAATERRWTLLIVLGATAAGSVVLALILFVFSGFGDHNDFPTEALPAYRALYHGHLQAFLRESPSYIGAEIWRAPFALAAMACGASRRLIYLTTAAPCFAALPLLGVWIARRHAGGPARRLAVIGLFAIVAVIDPLVWFAGALGHPEEIVAIALAIAAVLVAGDGRPVAAIVLVIVAMLNKPGLAEVIPVVLVAGRWRYTGRALVVCLAVSTLYAVYNLTALHSSIPISHLESVTSAGDFVPFQLLWWIGQNSWLAQNEHVLLVPVCVLLAAAWFHRRESRPAGSPADRERTVLWLTAFMLLFRTAFDPWDNIYYNLPLVICLLCLEARRWATDGRLPVMTAAASVAALLAVPTSRILPISGGAQAAVFTAVALPALIGLAWRAYGLAPLASPSRSETPAHGGLRRVLPSPSRPPTLPTSADSRSHP
jgi:hypothetical protein